MLSLLVKPLFSRCFKEKRKTNQNISNQIAIASNYISNKKLNLNCKLNLRHVKIGSESNCIQSKVVAAGWKALCLSLLSLLRDFPFTLTSLITLNYTP
jgi:hypothetical protein